MQTIYQCTWPGCKTQKQLCEDIERHVREKHLRRPAPQRPEDDDHEEEFYYNEIEVPVRSQVGKQQQAGGGSHTVAKLMGGGDQPTNLVVHKTRPTTVLTACPPAPVISDHMDMARPPHENPEYGGRPILPANNSAIATIISGGTALQWTSGEPQTPAPGSSTPVSASTAMHAMPIAIPITTLNIVSTSQQVSTSLSLPVFHLKCFISVARQVYPPVSQAVQHQSQVPPQTAPGRRQEVQEGVRDGAPGDVVHSMQMEEGLHQVRRGSLGPDHPQSDWRTVRDY